MIEVQQSCLYEGKNPQDFQKVHEHHLCMTTFPAFSFAPTYPQLP